MPIDNEMLAYTAGLFDGEGCVNFTAAGKYGYVLRVAIVNTDASIIDFLKTNFGGRIEARTTHLKMVSWKQAYCWRLDRDAAVAFLYKIEPWVRIKKEQIWVATAWDVVRNRTPSRSLPQDYKEMVDLLVRQLSWLNRKGRRKAEDVEPVSACLATLKVPVEQIISELGLCH